MNVLYAFLVILLRPIYHLFFRIKTHGKENIPSKDKSFIVCANHLSGHDIVLVAIKMKRQVHFLAKEEIVKNPIIRFFAKKLGVIPIKRGDADIAAIRESIKVLKNGHILGVFPQGTRYKGVATEISQFKSGVGMIAYRAKADILPVYIKSKNNRIKLFRKVELYFGEPIKFSELGFENGRFAEMETASALIAKRIVSLCHENK